MIDPDSLHVMGGNGREAVLDRKCILVAPKARVWSYIVWSLLVMCWRKLAHTMFLYWPSHVENELVCSISKDFPESSARGVEGGKRSPARLWEVSTLQWWWGGGSILSQPHAHGFFLVRTALKRRGEIRMWQFNDPAFKTTFPPWLSTCHPITEGHREQTH